METTKAIIFMIIILGMVFLFLFCGESQTEKNKGREFSRKQEPDQLIDYDEIENDYKLN